MKVKFKYHILLMSVLLIAFTSCEKVVQLKLDNAEPQLVIEGAVTSQSTNHIVKISYSVPFTDSNNFPAVSGAVVTITDNHNGVFPLTEASPGAYITTKFAGRIGYTYTLTVTVNGKTYTGSSTMPALVRFDNLSYKDSFFNADKKIITVHYAEPANTANQYRFIMFVNSVQVKTIFDDDDSFTNGRYVDEDLFQDLVDIKKGDVVTIEGQCIDRNIYTYWFSLSQQDGGGRGGSPSPSNPPSNLNNNALGYFSAHTVQRLNITIQ